MEKLRGLEGTKERRTKCSTPAEKKVMLKNKIALQRTEEGSVELMVLWQTSKPELLPPNEAIKT